MGKYMIIHVPSGKQFNNRLECKLYLGNLNTTGVFLEMGSHFTMVDNEK